VPMTGAVPESPFGYSIDGVPATVNVIDEAYFESRSRAKPTSHVTACVADQSNRSATSPAQMLLNLPTLRPQLETKKARDDLEPTW